MKVSSFDQVYALACEAFWVGEPLVLKSAEKVVCLQPQFQWKLPALRVVVFSPDLQTQEAFEFGKYQFDRAQLHGMEVPKLFADLLEGVRSDKEPLRY